jgi:hypothetical protein
MASMFAKVFSIRNKTGGERKRKDMSASKEIVKKNIGE